MEDIKNTNNPEVIDLREVFKVLLKKKMFFLKIWVVTFVLSCIYILPQPRTYTSEIVLAPEMGGQSIGGSLAGIASSFGIDLGSNAGQDAFYPELYPDLMETNRFVVDMLYTNVKSADGTIDKTYLDYLKQDWRKNPYLVPFYWCRAKINNLLDDTPSQGSAPGERLNPNRLSKKELNLVELARKNMSCDVDIKTNVITISVLSQDPLICTTLANTASDRLQEFITDYRTHKARIDTEYYQLLLDSAQVEYQAALKAYSDYCDSNQDILLQSHISQRDKLENDLQTKQSTLTALQAQYNMAKAKIQERTPAFTVLSEPFVPVKASGPKRMIFVALMLFLATLGGAFYIFKDKLLA